jgi:hypothetical protein
MLFTSFFCDVCLQQQEQEQQVVVVVPEHHNDHCDGRRFDIFGMHRAQKKRAPCCYATCSANNDTMKVGQSDSRDNTVMFTLLCCKAFFCLE